MVLDSSIKAENAHIDKLNEDIDTDNGDLFEKVEQLNQSRQHRQQLETTRHRKFNALGVPDSNHLNSLKNNAFLRTRMNALAVKVRLRDKLRQRKFELERLERAYRRTATGGLLNTSSVLNVS